MRSLFAWLGLCPRATALEIGAPLPDVAGINRDGLPGAASGYTLVYFYPKADTPGCTAQSCSLRDGYEALREKGVRVLGVSTDTPLAQARFRQKYRLPFELIADPEGKVIEAFGVSRFPLVGFASRQAYLFKDGVLIWRDLNASTKTQAADVLKVLAED